jgi:hypothetical protein
VGLRPVWTGAENLAPPPEFDSRTVQPVASRYADYATRPKTTPEKLCNFTSAVDGVLMGNTSHQFAAMGNTTPYTSQKIGTINMNFTVNKLGNICIT